MRGSRRTGPPQLRDNAAHPANWTNAAISCSTILTSVVHGAPHGHYRGAAPILLLLLAPGANLAAARAGLAIDPVELPARPSAHAWGPKSHGLEPTRFCVYNPTSLIRPPSRKEGRDGLSARSVSIAALPMRRPHAALPYRAAPGGRAAVVAHLCVPRLRQRSDSFGAAAPGRPDVGAALAGVS